MSVDLANAVIQLPLATILSVMYLREAYRLRILPRKRARRFGFTVMGSITAGLMSWRFSTIAAWAPPELEPAGDITTQTLLLIGLGIAYLLLRDNRLI